jgi:beta-glucanase (GH16 family)
MADSTQVFFEDFNGSGLDRSLWKSLYSGQYGNGMFNWDPAQLEVGDGKLTIATERNGNSWLSGGLATIPEGQTYGTYEFRARFDPGQGTSGAILLWPSDNQWTDEVDIVEAHRPQRDGFAFSNHGSPNVTNYIDNVKISDWHTYRLDWTPGSLKLFVDNQQTSEITTDVPSQPMSFAMQGQVMAPHETWFGGGPDGSTPNRVELEVDWVRVSAYAPGQATHPAPQASVSTTTEASLQTAAVAPVNPDVDWLAAARTYVENDGTWDGSWRNQVEAGQITLEDVAGRLQAGLGNPDLWQ